MACAYCSPHAVSVPHHFMSMYIKFQSGHTQFFKINFNICFFSNGECAAQVQNQRSVYCERVGGGGKNELKLKVETHPRMATNFWVVFKPKLMWLKFY